MIQRILTVLLVLMAVVTARVTAQEDVVVRVARLDVADFPLVRINLLTADARSVPLSDLSALSLRENGTPIADYELQVVPVGIDAVFVIDANETLQVVDSSLSGLSRYQKVQESITRFAQRFMSPSGRDRVSIVVPDADGTGGRLLLENATDPQAVVNAIEAYEPTFLPITPLDEMMSLAVERAAAHHNNSRFQAVLLFSDGGQLDQQLAYEELVAQAQEIHLPLFTAILGGEADTSEVNNAMRLSQPTRAFHVHAPTAEESDTVYLVWQRQGNQPQIRYRSLQTRSGRYAITINIGEQRATAVMALALAAPEVSIALEKDVIRRMGNALDTPLASLAPVTYTVPITVAWPDELPRRLASVTLQVDGTPVALLEDVAAADAADLALTWQIASADAGTYELVVEVVDELAFTAASDPVLMAVVVERPQPPTPTAVPTPPAVVATTTSDTGQETWTLALSGVAGVCALALLLLRRRRRSTAEPLTPPAVKKTASPAPLSEHAPDTTLVASLEVLEGAADSDTSIPVASDNITIGRDAAEADIVVQDRSVSRLHARIRRRNGAYWLYDEGSATGTQLNFERLGLAPRPLQNGDTIHVGRVALRFHLRPEAAETPQERDGSDDAAAAENNEESVSAGEDKVEEQ